MIDHRALALAGILVAFILGVMVSPAITGYVPATQCPNQQGADR